MTVGTQIRREEGEGRGPFKPPQPPGAGASDGYMGGEGGGLENWSVTCRERERPDGARRDLNPEHIVTLGRPGRG